MLKGEFKIIKKDVETGNVTFESDWMPNRVTNVGLTRIIFSNGFQLGQYLCIGRSIASTEDAITFGSHIRDRVVGTDIGGVDTYVTKGGNDPFIEWVQQFAPPERNRIVGAVGFNDNDTQLKEGVVAASAISPTVTQTTTETLIAFYRLKFADYSGLSGYTGLLGRTALSALFKDHYTGLQTGNFLDIPNAHRINGTYFKDQGSLTSGGIRPGSNLKADTWWSIPTTRPQLFGLTDGIAKTSNNNGEWLYDGPGNNRHGNVQFTAGETSSNTFDDVADINDATWGKRTYTFTGDLTDADIGAIHAAWGTHRQSWAYPQDIYGLMAIYGNLFPSTQTKTQNGYKHTTTKTKPFFDATDIATTTGTVTLNTDNWVDSDWANLYRIEFTTTGGVGTAEYNILKRRQTGFRLNTYSPRYQWVPLEPGWMAGPGWNPLFQNPWSNGDSAISTPWFGAKHDNLAKSIGPTTGDQGWYDGSGGGTLSSSSYQSLGTGYGNLRTRENATNRSHGEIPTPIDNHTIVLVDNSSVLVYDMATPYAYVYSDIVRTDWTATALGQYEYDEISDTLWLACAETGLWKIENPKSASAVVSNSQPTVTGVVGPVDGNKVYAIALGADTGSGYRNLHVVIEGALAISTNNGTSWTGYDNSTAFTFTYPTIENNWSKTMGMKVDQSSGTDYKTLILHHDSANHTGAYDDITKLYGVWWGRLDDTVELHTDSQALGTAIASLSPTRNEGIVLGDPDTVTSFDDVRANLPEGRRFLKHWYGCGPTQGEWAFASHHHDRQYQAEGNVGTSQGPARITYGRNLDSSLEIQGTLRWDSDGLGREVTPGSSHNRRLYMSSYQGGRFFFDNQYGWTGADNILQFGNDDNGNDYIIKSVRANNSLPFGATNEDYDPTYVLWKLPSDGSTPTWLQRNEAGLEVSGIYLGDGMLLTPYVCCPAQTTKYGSTSFGLEVVGYELSHLSDSNTPLGADTNAALTGAIWDRFSWNGSAWVNVDSEGGATPPIQTRTTHGTTETLIDGTTIAFDDNGATQQFVDGEYITVGVLNGVQMDGNTEYTTTVGISWLPTANDPFTLNQAIPSTSNATDLLSINAANSRTWDFEDNSTSISTLVSGYSSWDDSAYRWELGEFNASNGEASQYGSISRQRLNGFRTDYQGWFADGTTAFSAWQDISLERHRNFDILTDDFEASYVNMFWDDSGSFNNTRMVDWSDAASGTGGIIAPGRITIGLTDPHVNGKALDTDSDELFLYCIQLQERDIANSDPYIRRQFEIRIKERGTTVYTTTLNVDSDMGMFVNHDCQLRSNNTGYLYFNFASTNTYPTSGPDWGKAFNMKREGTTLTYYFGDSAVYTSTATVDSDLSLIRGLGPSPEIMGNVVGGNGRYSHDGYQIRVHAKGMSGNWIRLGTGIEGVNNPNFYQYDLSSTGGYTIKIDGVEANVAYYNDHHTELAAGEVSVYPAQGYIRFADSDVGKTVTASLPYQLK